MNRRDLFKAALALPFVALGVKATKDDTLNEAIREANVGTVPIRTSGYAQWLHDNNVPTSTLTTANTFGYFRIEMTDLRGGYRHA